ncbi:MAG: ABC transporter substrate-binding protein [Rhodopseudomonas sp.]|nr:ABC transporter substrate-binding protein [Rhodopseudomonas sp.]
MTNNSFKTPGIDRRTVCAGLGAGLATGLVPFRAASAAEKATYLFPAPPILPAFGPIQLAKGRGYFEKAGVDLAFAVGKGGVDVAQQVGAGNATVGGIVGDGPILVRGNGVPVKIVCVFGGRGFMQMVVRADSGVTKPADLKGKTITVMSYQDTTYYALLGLLASAGLSKADVNIQAAGPTGVWQLVAAGKAAGMAGVPDWVPPLQAANVKVNILQTEEYFPHMAQGIAASDTTIKTKPEIVGKIVKAALHGMKDIMDDPAGAAEDFVKFVPTWKGKEAAIKWTFAYYAKNVYPGQKVIGEVNGERLKKLEAFYIDKGIIHNKVPVDELYTNQFVGL